MAPLLSAVGVADEIDGPAASRVAGEDMSPVKSCRGRTELLQKQKRQSATLYIGACRSSRVHSREARIPHHVLY